jgi:6-pyruvoyltetrahydropterin/6-carboxytetrahydropterin synthase
MPTTVTKRLEIDCGHRLAHHEGKCRSYHGHHYGFEFTCCQVDEKLDEVGRVVDFSVIKELVGGWLDEHWDHGMLLEWDDPLVELMKATGSKVCPIACPPTAENLARLAFDAAAQLLKPHGVLVLHVTCYETPTARAGYAR